MWNNRIRLIASAIIRQRIVRHEDVALLRDLTLIYGAISRDEAGDLVRIERHVTNISSDWPSFFTETLTSHLVWESRPTGTLTEADAAWLNLRLGLSSVGHSQCSRALIDALASESHDPEEVRAFFRGIARCEQMVPRAVPKNQTGDNVMPFPGRVYRARFSA
ncbi:MAG: hypothetical protein ACKOC1_06825 [Hyphomicrobiales bacterium]